MRNPWEEIPLADYENHMSLRSVMQLQALNERMKEQLNRYSVSSVMILGVAGGNGLEHIARGRYQKVYGVDVNRDYLREAARRNPHLDGCLECLPVDLIRPGDRLPQAELVVANLLVEYIGPARFQEVLRRVGPRYVSCVIQVDLEGHWVSDSPYQAAFHGLEAVHQPVEREALEEALAQIQYRVLGAREYPLTNVKKFVQLDFEK